MRRNRARAAALTVLAASLLGACGSDPDSRPGPGSGSGSAADADGDRVRTVEIEMVDIAFEPETLRVARGERVRFRFRNEGEVTHDAFIGDAHAQADHEADMRAGGEDGHAHDDASEPAVTVEPGRTRELTYTFDRAGRVEIGCHQPGHYAAGMKVAVEVV